MPRQSRKNSKTITNTYHIMLRGINRQDIFLDDFDRKKFIKEIMKTKEKYKYMIYAYVLMDNHVHMIIFDPEDMLSGIIHDICMNYAIYFNKRYERVGHLFQNRFKSKCVDTQEYLLNLVRYIHNNPVNKIDEYKWSSYREYVKIPYITDTKFVLDMLSENKKEAIVKFIEHAKIGHVTEKEVLDFEFDYKKISDEIAINQIKLVCGIDDVMMVNEDKSRRDQYIKKILKIEGITIEQIARVLNVSRRTIHRIKKV